MDTVHKVNCFIQLCAAKMTRSSMEHKSKILHLLKLLYEKTDEMHPLTTNEIIEELSKIGISVARKKVASDIAMLEEFGIDIITIKSSQNKYYIGARKFELPEINLLIDAVESSKLITPKKSRILVEKISSMVSDYQSSELVSRVFIDERIKPYNEEIYYTIDCINEAIKLKKQIDFKYIDYNQNKEIYFKNNGHIYGMSPFAFTWNSDHYYIIGHSVKHGKIVTFRVDRMTKAVLTERSAVPVPDGFNAAEFVKDVFDMYDGDKKCVELKCENDLMKVIIDKFGENVKVKPIDSDSFKAIVEVSVSPTFFGWVFQFGKKMKILAPRQVKDEYLKCLNEALNEL